MEKDTAILVLSCDKYKDAWNPFFILFKKYWPSCNFPVFLGVNEQDFTFEGIQVIKSGKALDWSNDTIHILKQIPYDYIILILEDYFFQRPVDTKWLDECIAFTKEKNASFMRIASFRKDHFPMYPFEISNENKRFGVNQNNGPYALNLQAGIWKKSELIELIKPGESPWEFEVNASIRSKNQNKLSLAIVESSNSNSIVGPLPYLCTAITKGVWMREAINLCKKENIKLVQNTRSIESKWQYFLRKTYHSMPFWTRKYLDFLR